jgi:hypothetical protein
MGFFQRVNYKYVEIWKFEKNHFEMEGDNHCELGQWLKSILYTYLDDWWNQYVV